MKRRHTHTHEVGGATARLVPPDSMRRRAGEHTAGAGFGDWVGRAPVGVEQLHHLGRIPARRQAGGC